MIWSAPPRSLRSVYPPHWIEHQASNLRVGGSNPSERASDFNGLNAIPRSTVFGEDRRGPHADPVSGIPSYRAFCLFLEPKGDRR
jgi:hypothetical protein